MQMAAKKQTPAHAAQGRSRADLGPETRPNGGEKQEIGRREQVRPPIHSYLKRRQRQQTPLTVIANLCPSVAVGMCGQSPERGNGPALTWKGTIVKKLLVSTLVAASLATAPAHAGNYDGLIAGGIIAGGLLAAAAAAAAANNHPHVIYQQGPTRVIYKRGPTRIIRVAAARPAPHKAAVVAPPAHHAAPAWTDLHQGAAAAH